MISRYQMNGIAVFLDGLVFMIFSHSYFFIADVIAATPAVSLMVVCGGFSPDGLWSSDGSVCEMADDSARSAFPQKFKHLKLAPHSGQGHTDCCDNYDVAD